MITLITDIATAGIHIGLSLFKLVFKLGRKVLAIILPG